ncbi:MAG: ABC transporter permease [Sulfurimonas sp.]|uniref:ABC transporter permease n=1 Tax=Sulfurimonas sp. TaxID=2022749 RepID=UPI0025F589B5|nr:ABC transporter permease [Sulfurimonas sp.]MCK9492018.1 ABC transporter permease [Sulfurimonas sp.]
MFKAMIKKEFLLVLRDKHALLALFVMPAIFILIMSVAMRDQFTNESIEFSLYVNDADISKISKDFLTKIEADKKFHLLDDETSAQFVVTIPKDYESKPNSKLSINVRDSIKSDEIEAFKAMLFEHVLSAKLENMVRNIEGVSPQISKILSDLEISVETMYEVSYNNSINIPNSTQQSVPAWIVFGMFFIIIPMSTIYVNERKQNTLARLNSMNVSIFAMGISKSIPYLVINQFQVLIMLGVGIYLVPLFDTPALVINGSFFALGAVSVALSIAAIGISSLIAVSAKSSEQATTIGGILNILLGAIGGVMVPKFIMPPVMQKLSEISPMSWGLDAFLDIFLKSANFSMVLNNVLMLITFGVISLMLSMLILQISIKKGF